MILMPIAAGLRHQTHEEFYADLRLRAAALPGVCFSDGGMTGSNCPREELSPGCLSCKSGTWVCIYPGFSCNAACPFCPRLTSENVTRRMGRRQIDLLLALIEGRGRRIAGVSISGGELFHDNFDAAKQIVGRLRRRCPHLYLWGYTNGIAATADAMRELRDLGLDELRFDLAATGFAPEIVRRVRDHAVRTFPWVSVEVPAYGPTRDYLIGRGGLLQLEEAGVRQLNLAEVHVPPPDPRAPGDTSPATRTFFGSSPLYEFRGALGERCLSLAESRHITFDVFEHAHRLRLGLKINDCSQEAKSLQVLRRKENGNQLVQAFAHGPIEFSADGRRGGRPRGAALAVVAAAAATRLGTRAAGVAVSLLGRAALAPFFRTGRSVRRGRRWVGGVGAHPAGRGQTSQ